MAPARTRRTGAVLLAGILGAGTMLLGAGSASAEPREVVCTIGALPNAVSVQEGDQVQLVVVLLGTRVAVGPAQTVSADTDVLSATVSGALASLLGLVGELCKAAVDVQATVTSAVPVPVPELPSVPMLPLPTQSVELPLPGAEVSVNLGGGSSAPPPGTQDPSQPGATPPPPLVTPGAPNGSPGYRFDPGALPRYDFSRTPYGVGNRFGSLAAPAFRFGQQVPGYAPQFGILGAENGDVAAAGKVQALPVRGSAPVALPVLLSVLMLSVVSGALVRTWVLRRAV
jgi:hypothetical protein